MYYLEVYTQNKKQEHDDQWKGEGSNWETEL